MGWGIALTKPQVEQLERLRSETASAVVFRNGTIILMSGDGQTIATIARHLGCGTDTVNRVRRAYRRGGIEALHPIKPPGRTSRADAPDRDQMRQALDTNPMTLGYGFATWSASRLAAHLAKLTGIHFSDDQLRRLLHRGGFSVHRPKHTLKGKRDEAAYEKAKNQLVRLKKKP
jgi:transposase